MVPINSASANYVTQVLFLACAGNSVKLHLADTKIAVPILTKKSLFQGCI